MAVVVVAGALAGRDALRGSGGRVLGAVLQPLHHLAFDGGADGLRGGGPQMVSRTLQSLLVLIER